MTYCILSRRSYWFHYKWSQWIPRQCMMLMGCSRQLWSSRPALPREAVEGPGWYHRFSVQSGCVCVSVIMGRVAGTVMDTHNRIMRWMVCVLMSQSEHVSDVSECNLFLWNIRALWCPYLNLNLRLCLDRVCWWNVLLRCCVCVYSYLCHLVLLVWCLGCSCSIWMGCFGGLVQCVV